ncbi:MAG: LysE family transporter [Pseudomonadota bacterium]
MELGHLIAFNAALAAAWIAPGPAMLVCVRSSLRGGWREGLATGIGLASMGAMWTMAALFGLEAVFRFFPWTYGVLKIAGALYLIWIAIQTWRHADDPVLETPVMQSKAFRNGALVNLANPKAVLFAGAVLVVIFPPDLPLSMRFAVGFNHFVFEAIAYGLLALFVDRSGLARPLLAAKKGLERATGVILGALGIRLLLDRTP